jgi:hypothetical protein
MNEMVIDLARGGRKLGFQPDFADTLPAWRTSIIVCRQAESQPVETGRMPILL